MTTSQRPLPMGRRTFIALPAAITAMALVSCSNGSKGESAGSGSSGSQEWPRTIETDDGDLVLESQPMTIVSTSVTLTGSLLAVGAPVKSSGVTASNIDGLSDDKGFFVQWSEVARKQGVEKLYENSAPDIEKVAAYSPDLIVVAKNGGDSAMDQVGKLRDIAPVLVIDYSVRSWQDITRTVARSTGREQQAEQVVSDYDARLSEVKSAISVPEGTTSAFIIFGDGTGAAALTREAPQTQVLSSLGFTIADIPEEVKGDTSMGADRGDIIKLSSENIQKGLTGDNWVVVAADKASHDAIANDPGFSTAPQVTEGRVAYTPSSTFRLDYYSALALLDSLRDSYKKA